MLAAIALCFYALIVMVMVYGKGLWTQNKRLAIFTMEITEEKYERIKDSLPVQRGNVTLSNLQVLNAVLYVTEQGCKWRGLPERFGKWHTIYMRMNRWAKNGVLDRVFEKLQMEQIVTPRTESDHQMQHRVAWFPMMNSRIGITAHPTGVSIAL